MDCTERCTKKVTWNDFERSSQWNPNDNVTNGHSACKTGSAIARSRLSLVEKKAKSRDWDRQVIGFLISGGWFVGYLQSMNGKCNKTVNEMASWMVSGVASPERWEWSFRSWRRIRTGNYSWTSSARSSVDGSQGERSAGIGRRIASHLSQAIHHPDQTIRPRA